ncbi:STAS domain-containing protein [Nocardioides sp.]|jgi:anti-anti-sigma factor|uniref:STAS domain-containing protein n=1 Tax=Nocardioides sp. TaxID=35761 RepID=UPI0031FEBECA|nr:anti-sigma factor antagonist [Nocardioides sp.]
MLLITQHTGLPSALLLRLDGELDLFSALHLRRVLNHVATTASRSLTIDLEHVLFVDASALGLLEKVWNELRARHVVVDVINPSPRFSWLVDIVGLRSTFGLPQPDGQPAS